MIWSIEWVFGESRHVLFTPHAFTTWSRKGLCRNPRGMNLFLGKFGGIFGWIFRAPFLWKERKHTHTTKNAQHNSNRTLGASRPNFTLQGSGLDTFLLASIILRNLELHTTQHKLGIKDRSYNRDKFDLQEGQGCREATPIPKPNCCLSRGVKGGDSKTIQAL